MKNVNLSGIFLAMVANFGVNGFELTSIVPEGGEPIDALIKFKGADVASFDETKANEILKDNITGEVIQAVAKVKHDAIEVYIEFVNSKVFDSLD